MKGFIIAVTAFAAGVAACAVYNKHKQSEEDENSEEDDIIRGSFNETDTNDDSEKPSLFKKIWDVISRRKLDNFTDCSAVVSLPWLKKRISERIHNNADRVVFGNIKALTEAYSQSYFKQIYEDYDYFIASIKGDNAFDISLIKNVGETDEKVTEMLGDEGMLVINA